MDGRSASAIITMLLIGCVAGRELQQAASGVQPVSLAAQPAAGAASAGNTINQQRLISNTNTEAVTATTIQPQGSDRRTLDQVNADAPTITDPSTKYSVRPVAASQPDVQDASSAGAPDAAGVTQAAAAQTTAADTVTATAQQRVGGTQGVVNPQNVGGATGLDAEVATGDYFSFLNGVRIATPFFGTGYNFCVDRYISSFPRVGIVIPNPAIWLLPDFQDLAATLSTTLSLPNLAPHGAFVEPTSDGFLLYLPSIQPSEVSNFGIRYGIQIGQALGYDFGIGILKDICYVSFVLV